MSTPGPDDGLHAWALSAVGPVISACIRCGLAVELAPAADYDWTTGMVWRHVHEGQDHRPRVVAVAVDDRGCRLLEDHDAAGRTAVTLAFLGGIGLATGAFIGGMLGAARVVVAWLT